MSRISLLLLKAEADQGRGVNNKDVLQLQVGV